MAIKQRTRSSRSSVSYVADEQAAWFVAGGFTAGDAATALRLITNHHPSWQDVRAALRRAASSMWRSS